MSLHLKRLVMEYCAISISIIMGMMILCEAQHFTNQWAVHIEGGEDVARELAARHGFLYVDQVRSTLLHIHDRCNSRC